MRRILTMTLMAVLAVPAMAWAAEAAAAAADWRRPSRSWPRAWASAWPRVCADWVRAARPARRWTPWRASPAPIARIQTAMLLGLAFIESLVLFVFVIAVILLFVKS